MEKVNLYKTIEADLKAAMKQKDEFRVKVLRFAKSQLDNAAKEKRDELSDSEVIKVLQKRIKQGKDSLDQFQRGGRDDLAKNESKEIELIEKYLPQAMSAEELEQIVDAVIVETGASSMKDFGRVMGAAVKKTEGAADGQMIKQVVEKKLK